jgi:hypothetical protein
MNTDNTDNVAADNLLRITIGISENYNGDANMQYQPPTLEYSDGPPRSFIINRGIPIDMMNQEQLNAECLWIDRLGPDLVNLGLSVHEANVVMMALEYDIRSSHPGFLP